MLRFYLNWLKFVNEISSPVIEPKFCTPNDVIMETNAYILRRFSNNIQINDSPVLLLPPQAGHSSVIADFSPKNSLVKTLLNNGINDVYVVEWKSANHKRRNESLDDLVIQVRECATKINSNYHLIGLCQSGWLAAIYASLFSNGVKTLTLAGSPIDAKADGGKIQHAVETLPLDFFRYLVMLGNGLYLGAFQLMAFKLMNPYDRFFSDYIKLYDNINDEKFLERHRHFRNWYETVQNLSGKWYLQIVKELFVENNLIKGKMKILNQLVDLKNINCPLFMIGGTTDDITLPNQVFNTEKYVSTPKENIHKYLVESGHIGLFMGSNALKEVWPKIANEIKSNFS